MNKDRPFIDPNSDSDYLYVKKDDTEFECPPGYTAQEITLEDLQEWNRYIQQQLVNKTRVLYFMPLNEIDDYIEKASFTDLPLGEFVLKSPVSPSQKKPAFKKLLMTLIPHLRQNRTSPLTFENFDTFFEKSQKDDINFELQFYFQISKSDAFELFQL